jgi:hypothetical protein
MNGPRIAELSGSQRETTVKAKRTGTSESELYVELNPGQGAVTASSLSAPNPSDNGYTRVCRSVESAKSSQPSREAEANRDSYFSLNVLAAQTSQIKVWVNPPGTEGVGGVNVTVQGPCAEHKKSTNAEGFALFGGCEVGATYVVSVPEHVSNEDRHYEDHAFGNANGFVLGHEGNVVTFGYTRVEAESPEEGGEKGRAELAIGEVEGPVTEELETEQAEASVSSVMPTVISAKLAGAFKEGYQCAAEGFRPFIHWEGGKIGVIAPYYLQCVPFTVFTELKLQAFLQVFNSDTDVEETRDELGGGGESGGIVRPTGLLEAPSFGGPYRLRTTCNVKKMKIWRTFRILAGLLDEPPFFEFESKEGGPKPLPCL